jgi:hypothetical protein
MVSESPGWLLMALVTSSMAAVPTSTPLMAESTSPDCKSPARCAGELGATIDTYTAVV